jgi:hypothetical protein
MDAKNLFIGLLTATVVLTLSEAIQPASARLVRRDLTENVKRKTNSNDRAIQRFEKMYEALTKGIIYGSGKRSKR